MKVLAIYDNGGKTWDRYTVVIDDNDETYTGKHWSMLGLSKNADMPDGFSQMSEGIYNLGGNNRHLGKRIRFEDLSATLQKHIAGRLFV